MVEKKGLAVLPVEDAAVGVGPTLLGTQDGGEHGQDQGCGDCDSAHGGPTEATDEEGLMIGAGRRCDSDSHPALRKMSR